MINFQKPATLSPLVSNDMYVFSKSQPKTMLEGKRNQNLGIFIRSTGLNLEMVKSKDIGLCKR